MPTRSSRGGWIAVTEYHTDPDGKRWERVSAPRFPFYCRIPPGDYTLVGNGLSRTVRVEAEVQPGDRWVLERPEPEMEEWVRLDDVRFIMSDMKGRLYDIEHGTIRRLPKSESRR
jgi:hypothetical protein